MTGALIRSCSCYKINIRFFLARLNSAPRVYPHVSFTYDTDGSDLLPTKSVHDAPKEVFTSKIGSHTLLN